MPAPEFLAPLALSALLAATAAVAQSSAALCGSLANGSNGPFDYRVDRDNRLKAVEEYHFNARVETLIAGQSGHIATDLDYVLRAFPNHHRALVSMSRLGLRHKLPVAPHAPLSVECYFERALRFKPDDTVARLLFANYLHEVKRGDEALRHVEQAIEFGKENPFTQYNAGLVLADLGRHDRALEQAHRALAMGFTRTGLKERLQAAGKWVEPPEAPASAPAEPAAAASAASSGS
jgi:tetratricopeptide (TPR) repeat protein